MAIRNHQAFKDDKRTKKKTNQGCSNKSRGAKRYRGQGGPRKRSKSPKK